MTGRRATMTVLVVGFWLAFPFRADGAPRQVTWDDLSMVVGKTVAIAMPRGAISGKARAVESDALVVDIDKTTDPKTYPKGSFRVPRAGLRVLEMRTKAVHNRIIGTTIGAVGGLAVGIGSAIAISGGILNNEHPTAAPAVGVGIWAGGTVGGYLIGNAADRRTTTIEILP